jgi:IS30 family transposase
MPYAHLSEHERVCIFHQRNADFSFAQCGRRLGRHRGTVAREVRRFRKAPIWPYFQIYLPDHAHRLARTTRSGKRGFRWTGHGPLLAYVKEKLAAKWSPEQIAGRLPLDHPGDAAMRVSHTSVYRWVKADRQAGGDHWKHLRQSHRRRRKAYGSGPRRGRIPGRVGIAERPAQAERRRQVGHWESDTVLGKRGRLATHVDRTSRYLLLARMDGGTAGQFNAASIRRFKTIPACGRRTLTADNGSEFTGHQHLGKRLGLKTFFADPYSSWQRGTNENTNGLLRQYLPKGCDMAAVSHRRVAIIERAMNNRPRKCLAYRTPAEVMSRALRLKC